MSIETTRNQQETNRVGSSPLLAPAPCFPWGFCMPGACSKPISPMHGIGPIHRNRSPTPPPASFFRSATILGAKLLGKYGPRVVVTAGGILAGLGMIISQLFHLPLGLYPGLRSARRLGIGFVYSTASPTALKWFPASKTGLISGIVVAGFGMGSAWVAPLARTTIASIGLQTTMLYFGIGMAVVVVIFAQFMRFPPVGMSPAETGTKKAAKELPPRIFPPGKSSAPGSST